jgi:hypothetical protein
MIVRTPDERLTFLQAIASRRKGVIAGALPAPFAGTLIADGYPGYQHLLARLAAIQQCCQHVIRRCRAVAKLGPGSLQSWAENVITVLRDAHRAVGEARNRGAAALDPGILAGLEKRYDQAVSTGTVHNRLRAWHDGNHPGYALGTWLREYKEQVLLFTRDFAVPWTNNVSERGAKAVKRHQAVSGYWHTLRTLARWCRIRSYLDSAAAHGLTAIDAIRTAIEGKPWLPPCTQSAKASSRHLVNDTSVDQQPAREDQVLPVPVSRIVAGFTGEARWPVPGLVPVPHFRQILRNRPAAGEHAGDQRRHIAGIPRALRRRVPGVLLRVIRRHRRTGAVPHGRVHPIEQHLQMIAGSRRTGRENAVTKILERQAERLTERILRPRPLLPRGNPHTAAIPRRRLA